MAFDVNEDAISAKSKVEANVRAEKIEVVKGGNSEAEQHG